jgi:hypothetical protein
LVLIAIVSSKSYGVANDLRSLFDRINNVGERNEAKTASSHFIQNERNAGGLMPKNVLMNARDSVQHEYRHPTTLEPSGDRARRPGEHQRLK